MSNDLPNGWEVVPLKDLVEPRSDRVSPQSIPDAPFIGMEHVEPHTNQVLQTVPASTMASNAARFYEGDVLYGRMRPYLNKVVSPLFDGLASAEFIVFPKNEVIDNRFLLRRLSSSDFTEFACRQYEGDRPRVKFDQLGNFKVLLPPAAEQARIVEKLDELLSDLDAGVAELKAAQRKLAQYRQSLLKAAVEGALTADWRATHKVVAASESSSRRKLGSSTSSSAQQQQKLDPGFRRDDGISETGAELLQLILSERRVRWEQKQLTKFAGQGKTPPIDWQSKYPEPVAPDTKGLSALPEGWVWASVDQLSFVVRGASPRPAGDPRYFGGDIPWITVGSLTADEGMYLDRVDQFVTPLGKEASRYIEPDTLLLTNSGATLGVPKITRIGGCINDGSVALLDVDDPLQTYLYWFMRTQTKRLRALNQGAAQPNLNTDIVRQIRVPLCPREEMAFVNELLEKSVQSAFVQAANLEQGLRQAAAQRKNLLKAAFAGQLVPQNPNDKSASELLAGIRAARVADGATNARKRGRKAKERPHER